MFECRGCGECCRRFPLVLNPDHIWWMLQDARRAEAEGDDTYGWEDTEGNRTCYELEPGTVRWLESLTPLDFEEASQGLLMDDRTNDVNEEADWSIQTFYSCGLVTEDNRCSIYDERPSVCRRYAPAAIGGHLSSPEQVLSEIDRLEDELKASKQRCQRADKILDALRHTLTQEDTLRQLEDQLAREKARPKP